jgi:hypothetical protein
MNIEEELYDVREAESLARNDDSPSYAPPKLYRAGAFAEITRGSSGSLALDFYLTDRT